MGHLLDKVCCIDEGNVRIRNNYNDNYFSEHLNTSYDPQQTSRTMPSSEIKFDSNKLIVKTLNNLPINTANIIRKQTGNPLNNYEILKSIGRGSYGSIMKVIHKTTGTIRSMKIIPKNNRKPGFTEEDIEREINILKSLDHPLIIKIFEFYSDDNNYYLITEYCSEGDLGEKIAEMVIPEMAVKILMFQIFSAVSYLHSRNIIHGDLKLENIMIDSSRPYDENGNKNSFISSIKEDFATIKRIQTKDFDMSPNSKRKFRRMKNFELKLIDFGCSKIFTTYKKKFEDTIGTLLYCSPEVLKNNYNSKCDIWGCGIIMYILLSGEIPFYGSTEKLITKKILSGKFDFDAKIFDKVSNQAKDLIEKCLAYDSNKRIDVKEALHHPFFKQDINPYNLFEENVDSIEVLQSLKTFSKHSKFHQTVLAFLSHNFAEKDQLDRLKKIFYTMDLNLDGKISREELSHAYEVAGLPIQKEQLDKIIQSIDFDNNGFIEYQEFIRVTIPKENLFTEVNLKTAFDLFDLDKNGGISLSEVCEVLGMNNKNVDESVINELLKEIHNSGDEEISFEQFKSIMNQFTNEI